MTAQQLKNSILQMAVQGKLVPQDPNDEPASVLLERIRVEKERLIREKKIKREKNPSVIFRGADNIPYEQIGDTITPLEVPFEIPESWEWVRLGELFQHNTGKALNGANRSGQLQKYITTSNLYWDRFELDNLKEMYFTESEIDKCTAVKGDLLVCEGGDIGRAAIWPFDYTICIQNHIHRIRAFGPLCTRFFYYLFDLYKHAGWMGGKGIAIQGLSSNVIHVLLFPLPPLLEQYRIVAALDAVLPYIKSYEKAEMALNNLNTSFPDFLRKSILQQAVQGKLIPQDPADEPAEVLLERIRAEKQRLVREGKIKKTKHESIIFRRDNSHYELVDGVERCIDEELPFDIPESWVWTRASFLGTMIRGKGIKRTETTNSGMPCIRYGEIYTSYDMAFEDVISFISPSLDKSCLHFTSGDVIFTLTGENKVDIAKAVAFLGNGQVAAGGDLAFWTAHGMNPLYLVYYMACPYCIELKRRTATGDIIVHISTTKVGNFLIPVPPLSEQHRIVAKIEELLPLTQSM